ncbi:hypothetical protein L226DRAFT_299768 [Lentinus tigrinus ALCF2SS1-7]|uniref:uncharacterized protein n=1 Tax=Lentinus tigrinus ALCF2SS1-7 TaxID=1328758 RepID=UPI001165D496|nr:hypothetical protein L226DRAFT_299768 [Lentinus tigrinus ALCF2SS1-7]
MPTRCRQKAPLQWTMLIPRAKKCIPCRIPVRRLTMHAHRTIMPRISKTLSPLALKMSLLLQLVPCDFSNDPSRTPEIVIGHYNTGYNLEFSGMHWSVLPEHLVRMSRSTDADGVSVASLDATYGGDRTTMLMLDDDERLSELHRQAGYSY